MKHDTLSRHRFVTALALALAPATAFADPQCKPFDSAGCFFVSAMIMSIFFVPIGIVALIAILVAAGRQPDGNGSRAVRWALGVFPVVYAVGMLSLQAFPEGFKAMGLPALAAAIYTAAAIRTLKSPSKK